MCEICSFSITRTVHVFQRKLGMDIKDIKCMSHNYTSFFPPLFCIQGEIIDVQIFFSKLNVGLFSKTIKYRANSNLVC